MKQKRPSHKRNKTLQELDDMAIKEQESQRPYVVQGIKSLKGSPSKLNSVMSSSQSGINQSAVLAAQAQKEYLKKMSNQSSAEHSYEQNDRTLKYLAANAVGREFDYEKLPQQWQIKEIFDEELKLLENSLQGHMFKNQKYMNPQLYRAEVSGNKNIKSNITQNSERMSRRSSNSSIYQNKNSQRSTKKNYRKKNLSEFEKMEQRIERDLANQQLAAKKEKQIDMLQNQLMMHDKGKRKWLIKHGKGHVLQFTNEEIAKLKECFNQLDDDGGGSIGIDELEEPLIGLGLAENRADVERMVEAVDEDGSGLIEFEEFLDIINNSDAGADGPSLISQFFKNLSNGKLGNKDLTFGVNVQEIRRELMMKAITGKGPEQVRGKEILMNVQVQSKAQQLRMKMEDVNGDSDDD